MPLLQREIKARMDIFALEGRGEVKARMEIFAHKASLSEDGGAM